MSFAKNLGKNIDKNTSKNFKSIKYCQKNLDHVKQSAADAHETNSEGEIQKTAETTGDWIGNKIADETKSVTKASHIIQ